MKRRKPDWADNLAASTSHMRMTRDGTVHRWDYAHPCNAWEGMPYFVRWPLAVLITVFFGGAFLAPLIALWR